jgi:hypothetical protein
MIKLLFESFYTFYPVLFKITTIPIETLFFILEQFGSSESPAVRYSSYILFTCILPPISLVFMGQILATLLKPKRVISLNTTQWWLMYGVLVGISGLIQAVIYFFPDSLLTQAIVGPPLGVIWIFLGLGGLGAIFFYGLKLIITLLLNRIQLIQTNQTVQRALFAALILTGLYPFILVPVVIVELFVNPLGNPAASQFFVINAAIKNTCFIDPERNNCPQTLEEIGYIEPKAFETMIQNNQVNYVYYPETNQYSLVVRYHPTRAVIFDWRLVEEFSMDLHEYEVSVLGQDRVIDPPAFAGPWTFEDWDYTNRQGTE